MLDWMQASQLSNTLVRVLFDCKDKIVVKITPVQSMFFGGHDNELAAVRLADTEHGLV